MVSALPAALKFQMPVPTIAAAEAEAAAVDVLGRVGPAGVDGETGDVGDRPEQEVEQVDAVRAQIEEQAGARDRRSNRQLERSAGRQRRGTSTCTDVTWPIAPLAQQCRGRAGTAAAPAGSTRPTAARRARESRRSCADTRAWFIAIGFSTRHGLPAAATASASSQWLDGGVAM